MSVQTVPNDHAVSSNCVKLNMASILTIKLWEFGEFRISLWSDGLFYAWKWELSTATSSKQTPPARQLMILTLRNWHRIIFNR